MLLSPCIGASFLARKLVWIRKNCLLAMVVDYGKFVNEYCICVGIVGVMQVCVYKCTWSLFWAQNWASNENMVH